MPPLDIFDPQAFFEKTSHFASQSRGLFRLTRLPVCLNTSRSNNRVVTPLNTDKIQTAFDLLKTGIVASAFDLPTFSLGTFDPFSYSGPTKKIAYGQMFNDINVTFQLMGKTPEEAKSLYYFFAKWHEGIGGPRHSEPVPRNGPATPAEIAPDYKVISDTTMFALEYYDNYIVDAMMTLYSPNVERSSGAASSDIQPHKIIEIYLSELYPITLLQSALSWDSADVPIQLNMAFTFHYAQVVNT